ncbi:MAG: TRAP transporter substrate-binding protein [Syntrophales bacterium]|nr:TRAP transporter substrate-binding protein [Syntrophales bacterium]
MKAKTGILLLAFLMAICLSAPAFAADAKTYTMRTTTPLAKSGSVGKGLDKLCELVAAKSGGRIKTTANYSGELGTQREQVEMVHDGALEVVTTLASGSARYVPQLALFEFPYIYKDEAHLVRVLNALEPEVSRLLASSNMVAIGGQNMGLRHMLNKKRPIQTVADMKGLKMRGPNPVYVGMFNALSASGTTTDWSEIYGAIQSGVIDGMEASPDMIFSMKFHEVAPYLSKTNHIAACVYYMIRKDWLESLPADLRKIVLDSARQAAAYQNELDNNVQSESLKKMVAAGLKVNDVKDVNEFMKNLETFKQGYVKEKGTAWQALYDKIIAVK